MDGSRVKISRCKFIENNLDSLGNKVVSLDHNLNGSFKKASIDSCFFYKNKSKGSLLEILTGDAFNIDSALTEIVSNQFVENNLAQWLLTLQVIGPSGQIYCDYFFSKKNTFKKVVGFSPNRILALTDFKKAYLRNVSLVDNESTGSIDFVRCKNVFLEKLVLENKNEPGYFSVYESGIEVSNAFGIVEYFEIAVGGSSIVFSNSFLKTISYLPDIFLTDRVSSPHPDTSTVSFRNTYVSHRLNNTHFPVANNFKSSFTHCYLPNTDCATLPAYVICGPGNLFGLDPMFVDTAAGDYRLQPCSPLVNAGTNTAVSPGDTDLDGRPRILGGTVDIGPYEMPGIALAAAPDVRGSCAGGTAGAATFSVMDACVPVSYVWSAASGGSGAGTGLAAGGLAPGGYTFTLTDANGFADTLALTVPETAPPNLAPVAVPVVCGDTLGGSATATVAGAAPPLAFAWAGGSTDSLLQNLPPGQYALTVTDAFGCSNTLTINVERTGNLDILPDVSPISCFGDTDGSITVAPADGRPPFVFQWQNGPAAPTWAMLGPGVYEGTVTDAFGCTAAWTFPLAAPDRLLASAFVADASGPTNADGGIAVTQIEGGTPPYTAAWSNGASGLTNAALLPGAYVLTLTDGQGCIFQDTFLVDFTIGTSDAAARAFKFSVSPNPAGSTAFANFELAENQDISLVVTDLLGRPVRTALAETRLAAGAHSQRLDLAGLPAGVYLVQLRGAAATGVVKVVKQ